ncbi:MAG: 3-deoxy-8-phosphooctulonate synthase [Gemmatimonadota bacterium]|nr:MAG: 3-deoxy-8-phosphooctulonate synthase [Gemmatimonadota bacterium]
MDSLWHPRPVVVAGPCVLEDNALNFAVARTLADLSSKLGLRAIFKASFDKANRSNRNAPRGPGLEAGIVALARVRDEVGLPVMTDVHEVWQVDRVAPTVDALQVPAFLCRQTDLLEAAGASGRPVNIKKGQWMAPEAMGGAVDKVIGAGGSDVILTERGTFFGFGDLVVDMRSFSRLKAATRCPVLFDATHSVQQPGRGVDMSSGGEPEYVPSLLCGAAAAGADGFFIETHPSPSDAPSDGASMWPLDRLEELLTRAVRVWQARSATVEVG